MNVRRAMLLVGLSLVALSSCQTPYEPRPLAEGESLLARMREHGVPGMSIARIDGGKIVSMRGYGVLDADADTRVTAQTRFQAASISKPVAAMAALAMVDRGLLDLDADVNDKLVRWRVPENDYEGKVTLRGLLRHTAGLNVHGFAGYERDGGAPDVVGVLRGRGNSPAVRVVTEPGTAWSYSGGGYTVLQCLMEDVMQRPFAEIMHELVLEPLGMTRSSYVQPLPLEFHAITAVAHGDDGAAINGRWHVYPEQAAAGLWTTAGDLAKFALSLHAASNGAAHPVLSADAVREMLRPGLNAWGLGPAIRSDGGFMHGGANAGFRCRMTISGSGQGTVVMTNSDRGGALINDLMLTLAAERD